MLVLLQPEPGCIAADAGVLAAAVPDAVAQTLACAVTGIKTDAVNATMARCSH